jgi:hypothetical protein
MLFLKIGRIAHESPPEGQVLLHIRSGVLHRSQSGALQVHPAGVRWMVPGLSANGGRDTLGAAAAYGPLLPGHAGAYDYPESVTEEWRQQ